MALVKSILSSASKNIEVRTRHGDSFIEKIYGEDAMKVVYGNKLGVSLGSKLLTNQMVSRIYGAYNDSALSKRKIDSFVSEMSINLDECEKGLDDYLSFNDFFARKLNHKSRPIDPDVNSAVSPGDGRLLVFPSIDETTISYVKWAPVSLLDLFQGNESLAERYRGGACGVLRLCPSDYHRFHFPAAGKAGITKPISGLLHSVNPYALERKIPVYAVNKRTMCELDSDIFGKILLMEVGAMFVGSIAQTYRAGMQVEKGEEKGFFKFGGSTCIFFFQKDVIEFDADLVKNSAEGYETYIQMGDRMGVLKNSVGQ